MGEHFQSIDQVKASAIDMAVKFGPKLVVAGLILFVGYLAARWAGNMVCRVLARGPRPHRRVGVEDELLTGLVADSEALQDALLDELGDGSSRLGEGNVGPPQQVSVVTGAVATEESVHDPPDGARPVARGQVVVGSVRDDLVDEQVVCSVPRGGPPQMTACTSAVAS